MVIICTFAPRLVSRVASLPVVASHLSELASWSLFQAFCQISTNNANMPRSLALADGMYGFLSNLHPHHIGLNVLFHHTKLTTSRAFCCGISYESWHQWFSYSTFSHTAAGPCAPEMACMVKRKSFGYHPMWCPTPKMRVFLIWQAMMRALDKWQFNPAPTSKSMGLDHQ